MGVPPSLPLRKSTEKEHSLEDNGIPYTGKGERGKKLIRAEKKHIFKDISVGNDIFFFLSFRIKTNAISPPLTNGGGRYQSRFPSVFPLGRFRHHPGGGGRKEGDN